MTLRDTRTAIGAVSELLRYHIKDRCGANVTVGPNDTNSGINLFLFELAVDPSMRSIPLDAGQPPPLWLVLRFRMTAFDSGGKSDTIAALTVFGAGLAALQELCYLPLSKIPKTDLAALEPNPEPLKVSLLEANSELLSRLVQGSGERYRLSAAFEVRPVMIAAATPASYGLLVGIDYQDAGKVIGEGGVKIAARPGLLPILAEVEPSSAAPGETVKLRGEGLTTDLLACLEGVDLPLTADPQGKVQLVLDEGLLGGDRISAGPRSLRLVYVLSSGRRRSSRPVIFDLQPRIEDTILDVALADPEDPDSDLITTLTVRGTLLGGDEDDVFVGLYREGATVASFDGWTPPKPASPPPDLQTHKYLVLPTQPSGDYRLILRVNGVQARQSPVFTLEDAP